MNDHLSHNGHQIDLLTVPEAAKVLRISRNLACELVARQELPAIRLGRVIRIPPYSLDERIASQVAQRVETEALSSPHESPRTSGPEVPW